MKAIGEFDNKYANIGAEGDEKAEEIIFSSRKVSVEVAHAGTSVAEFGNTVDKEGNGFPEGLFYFI